MDQRSQELWRRACAVIPGGVNSPVRACHNVDSLPLFIAEAHGCRLTDVDGRQFIDFVLSWGPMILGHDEPSVTEAVRAAAGRGTSYGAPCPDEVLLAEAVTAAMPIPTMANRQAMLRRRKRRTCPLAFCFFIGITLPYASILCTAVQVQNLSPAEKEVPPLKKLWTSPFVLFLREAIMLYFSRRVPQAAACLAYFVLLTVFPVLICVSYILGMVNIDIVSLMDQLQPLLPEAALDVLESYLRYISFHQTPGLFLAGLAGCWFSAAAAFRTITRVIIDMYEDVSQSMVRGMVASILFPLGLLVTVDLSVIVVVTGQRTLAAVAQRFPFWDHVLNLWSWTRYVLLFSIFFLFILAVLNMAAPFGTPRLPVLLSSLVSALALVVSSAVFSWFISMSSRYSLVYGSLVSLIILLIWLYLCGQILFIGIVFTSVWYKHWRRRRLTDPDD